MVFIFFIQDTMKTGKYDENQMSIDASAIEGTTGISSSDLYHSQIGTMIRVGKYVFAVHQTKGLLVIDPEKDIVVKTILKPGMIVITAWALSCFLKMVIYGPA